jgi:hypothetical protein
VVSRRPTTNDRVQASDADGDGIDGGDRHEHYFYSGWRLIEVRNNAGSTLGQFVRGSTAARNWCAGTVIRSSPMQPVRGSARWRAKGGESPGTTIAAAVHET